MYFTVIVLLSTLNELTTGFLWSCEYNPCGPDDPHTMCRYPAGINRMTEKCMGRGSGSVELDYSHKKRILDSHNKFRSKVAVGDTGTNQPAASNIMKLNWNLELEQIALRWVQQCRFEHDSCNKLKNGSSVGQNLAAVGAGPQTYRDPDELAIFLGNMTELWYNEITLMPDNPNLENYELGPMNFPATGHYTAMTWANVREVGCGAISRKAEPSGNKVIVMGCNYSPGPNIIGTQVYKVGEACADCPQDSKCSNRFKGLCTFDLNEDDDIPSSSTLFIPRSLKTLLLLIVLIIYYV